MAPNLPLSLWFKGSGCHYNSRNNTGIYIGNETFCSSKIVVCQKGMYLFNSVFNFPTVIRFKLQSSARLNEANLTSATQTLNFNPAMHYRAKTSRPYEKIENKITNL